MDGNTIIQATIYIYFVAFAAGMGLLTAFGIGFKLYKRSVNKTDQKTNKRIKRGATV